MSKVFRAETIHAGLAHPIPDGQLAMSIDNLDASIAANWVITQAWFDFSGPPENSPRSDTMLFIGYNFNTVQGRTDPTEPAFGWQMETYDFAADHVTTLVTWHFSYLHTDDTLVRPIDGSIVRATGASSISFQNTNFAIYAQDGATLLGHVARNGGNVGFGIGTIANANVDGAHIQGSVPLLLENPGGTANNKLWDLTWEGNSLKLRLVNDAYSAAADVFRVDRNGAALSPFYMFAKQGFVTAGGASASFVWSKSATVMVLDSDTVETYNTRLALQTIDIQGAANNGGATATLTNSPFAGDPDQWIPVYWQGALGYVPWWNA